MSEPEPYDQRKLDNFDLVELLIDDSLSELRIRLLLFEQEELTHETVAKLMRVAWAIGLRAGISRKVDRELLRLGYAPKP